ncbi:MAG: TonB-dependent receptor plug domain-containing protein [Acinetobacter amyesii]|uniref:TonB-dependent receptor plug domain-containing protein n=1 Tax=Acinetobacter amyesii TaxID=2942470 RepID=UPI003CFDE7DD
MSLQQFNYSTLFLSLMMISSYSLASSQEDVITLGDVNVIGKKTQAKVKIRNEEIKNKTPKQIISAQALENTGATRLDEALNKLSPSFHFPQGGYVNNGVKAISLNGLSTDQAILLINGVPRHATSVVNTSGAFKGAQPSDLSSLPVSAIERVEIINSTEALKYGIDTGAGAINIILKNQDNSGSVSLKTGVYSEQSNRDNYSANAWAGFSIAEEGSLTISLDAYKEQHPESGVADPRQWYFDNDPREAAAQKDKVKWGYLPDRETFNALINAQIPINDHLKLYGNIGAGESENIAAQNFITPRDDGNVRELYPDGFQPHQTYSKKDFATTVGAEFNNDSQIIDFNVSYGRNSQSSVVDPSVNATLGNESPKSFYLGKRVNEDFLTNLSYNQILTQNIFDLVLLNAGVNYKNTQYVASRGDYGSYAAVDGAVILDGPNAGRTPTPGSRGNAGIAPQDEADLSRDALSLYLGTDINVNERLDVNLISRFTDYSDVDSALTGGVSAKFKITPQVNLRGSVSHAYRAPGLAQIGYSQTGIQAGTGTQFIQIRGLPVNSPAAVALGAEQLKGEKINNYSLGVTLNPIEQASITFDLYQIDIKDRISLTDNLSGTYVRQLLTDAGYSEISSANFYNNGLDTKTTGVQITSKFSPNIGQYGDLDLNLAYSYNDTEVKNVKDNPEILKGTGVVLYGRQAIGNLEKANPKDKLIFGANYKKEKFSSSFNLTRYGSFVDTDAVNPAYDQKYDAQWVFDLDLGYQVLPSLKFNVGAQNLFNSFPEKQISQRRTLGQTEYSPLSPAGYDGRYGYLQLTYNF